MYVGYLVPNNNLGQASKNLVLIWFGWTTEKNESEKITDTMIGTGLKSQRYSGTDYIAQPPHGKLILRVAGDIVFIM